jgi:hypothetical protein
VPSLLVALFAAWGAYALSGAGVIRPLPLRRTALVLIAAIYTLRGLLLVPELVQLARGGLAAPRIAVFSTVSLAIGLLYIVGLVSSRGRKAGFAGLRHLWAGPVRLCPSESVRWKTAGGSTTAIWSDSTAILSG